MGTLHDNQYTFMTISHLITFIYNFTITTFFNRITNDCSFLPKSKTESIIVILRFLPPVVLTSTDFDHITSILMLVSVSQNTGVSFLLLAFSKR